VLTDSTGHTLDHILKRFGREVKDFKDGGEMHNDLYHALYDYYVDDMPYDAKKNQNGQDSYEWLSDQLADELGINEGAAVDAETALEGADFANELSAAEQGAVQVSPELMMEAPSKLIKVPGAEAGSAEGINPKIFDPALTNGVEKIVQPKTTGVDHLTNEQILQIANGEMPVDPEIAQALLKTPQVQNGRSPSLDMASSEIDPQLMNMEDFLAQKNLAAKKHLNNAHAYGLNPKASMQKAGLEHGLNSTQTINELGGSTGEASGGANSGINSQQFILSSQIDMGSNAQANEATASVKTFNMSNIKTENSNQIMNQITDYIVQAKASKEPTVNMRVNHEQLGMIDITVNRVAAG
jgi:hypothetical protein